MADDGLGAANLAYGVLRPLGSDPRPVVRVGDQAIDLRAATEVLPVPAGTFAAPTLNRFLELGRSVWTATRDRLQELLGDLPLVPLDGAQLLLPIEVGDYVDFYASIEHATNLGRLFRPDAEPLLPNWRHLPVGYHGRAGTIVLSGTPIRRPTGQLGPGPFGPEPRLDIELELAFVTGRCPSLGTPIRASAADDYPFGV